MDLWPFRLDVCFVTWSKGHFNQMSQSKVIRVFHAPSL
jgi:hypothetical protein